MARARDPDIAGLYAAMERYIDGDSRSFSRLHGVLTPRLRGFLSRLVGDREVVDDLLQATMLKAHLARGRFELQGGDPDGAVQAWYFAIARNAAMDHLRQRYRRQRREAFTGGVGDDERDPIANLADQGPTVEELGLDREREAEIVERVQAAIAQLPTGQREVVEYHKLAGMSMAEVAQRLDLREGAVRVRAHRAYKTLARWLLPMIVFMLWYPR